MNMVFCTVVIPTIGRKSLARTVQSVLTQNFPLDRYEVILVNDAGGKIPEASWSHTRNLTVLNTNRVERCFARNSGAAVARGEYLIFLDDDDWLLPGALAHFEKLALRYPEAGWLYGGVRIVDEQNRTFAEINSGLQGDCFAEIMGGAWAPIQASMVRYTTFFAIGGFNPSIIGTEDLDLCRRAAFHGPIANTRAVVGCLQRGKAWNTSTNYRRAAEDTRLSRDLLLAQPGAFRRLRTSAKTSYWHGRNAQAYLSAFKWNIQRKRWSTAINRAINAGLYFVLSMPHGLLPDFWRGIRADHVPNTLHFVMKAYKEATR